MSVAHDLCSYGVFILSVSVLHLLYNFMSVLLTNKRTINHSRTNGRDRFQRERLHGNGVPKVILTVGTAFPGTLFVNTPQNAT